MTIETHFQPTPPSEEFVLDSAVAGFMDAVGMALLVVDATGTVRCRNTLATEMLSPGDNLESIFNGARFLGVFEGWDAELVRIVDTGAVRRLECALPRTETQSPLLVTLRCAALQDPASAPVAGVAILLERSAAPAENDSRIEVSKRLASLGKLATQVAHELNNPLDGILRYINLAMRVAGDAPESRLKSYLVESRTGLMRMVQIIGDLLEFSRSTDGEFDEINVNDAVEQAMQAHADLARAANVVVAADFQTAGMPCVRGIRLHQVCCNLIKNAIDAMPGGGRLTITTGLVDDEVVIRVADTGTGLPDPSEKVFEPFFTTKEPGKGTGLGLAICRDFVTDMAGRITAAAGEEGGAVFTVCIPEHSCRPASPLTDAKTSPLPR